MSPARGLYVARRRLITPKPAVILTSAYQSMVVGEANLKAFYRLQETSGSVAKDSSGNGLDGTINATPPPMGLTGPLFEGDKAMGGVGGWGNTTKNVALPAGLSINSSKSIAVEMWYLLGAGHSTDTCSGWTIGNSPSGQTNRVQAHMPYSGALYWDYGAWNSAAGRISVTYPGGSVGAWAHLVFTADTTNGQKIYANGASIVTNVSWAVSGAIFTGGFIGCWPNGAVNPANATIAEFAVYQGPDAATAALSGTRILAHYNKGISG